MEIREYDMMTDEARGIRTAVFVVEKDYRPEFDEWDEPGRATRLLAFGNGRAVATCRLYPDLDHADQPGRWVIGRLAVVADERGHGIGKTVLAEAERLAFKVMITTNGTLLPEKGRLLLASPSIHKVNLSLQSFEANSSGEMESYLRGCVDFVKEAAFRGILCEFRLWNQGGLDSRNQEIMTFLHRAFPDPWQESRNGQKLGDRVWLDPGERFDWPKLELEELRQTGFCYGLRDQIGILCDGTVVPCCLDHNGDIPLGNLFEQELREILESPRARAVYEGFSGRKVVEPLCKRCGYATRFQK